MEIWHPFFLLVFVRFIREQLPENTDEERQRQKKLKDRLTIAAEGIYKIIILFAVLAPKS